MNDNILYPKNINDLKIKIKYYIENEPDGFELNGYNEMLEWINKIETKVDYTCKDCEYFRIYKKGNKFALQVWKKDDYLSVVLFNAVANFINEYSTDETVLVDM